MSLALGGVLLPRPPAGLAQQSLVSDVACGRTILLVAGLRDGLYWAQGGTKVTSLMHSLGPQLSSGWRACFLSSELEMSIELPIVKALLA